ncbi:MAG: orotidine-5'-phosphate decarboxylase [Phycisphaerales bacterium]|nr:orotidine-5'-phosphate decarboxylase [Phycisphaerales bacterium]
MPENFADRLLDAIDTKGAPICVGIDPIVEMIPAAITDGRHLRNPDDADAAVDAIFEFTISVLKLIAPVVPIVKFQSAYFERYLWEGVEAYFSLVQEAREMGLLVIGDIKRGDIGSTSAAYARGHLAEPTFDDHEEVLVPDAVTVNPMLGLDTLTPFVDTAIEYDKGLFVLVRTSNPGSSELQDVLLATGQTWSQLLAEKLALVADQPGLMGQYGYSSLGAVVGATQVHTIESMRQRLPKSIFLLPGYGTQGATAEMTRRAFDANGRGAIVSASRSILYAHRNEKYRARFGDDWQQCVSAAVTDMHNDLKAVLKR